MIIILKPVIICILTLVFCIILNNSMPQFVPLLILCAGISIFMYLIPFIKSCVDLIRYFYNMSNSNTKNIIDIILKIVIIAIICEFSSQLCYDSTEYYLATKIAFAGKIIIIATISPYIISFMKSILSSIGEI